MLTGLSSPPFFVPCLTAIHGILWCFLLCQCFERSAGVRESTTTLKREAIRVCHKQQPSSHLVCLKKCLILMELDVLSCRATIRRNNFADSARCDLKINHTVLNFVHEASIKSVLLTSTSAAKQACVAKTVKIIERF